MLCVLTYCTRETLLELEVDFGSAIRRCPEESSHRPIEWSGSESARRGVRTPPLWAGGECRLRGSGTELLWPWTPCFDEASSHQAGWSRRQQLWLKRQAGHSKPAIAMTTADGCTTSSSSSSRPDVTWIASTIYTRSQSLHYRRRYRPTLTHRCTVIWTVRQRKTDICGAVVLGLDLWDSVRGTAGHLRPIHRFPTDMRSREVVT